MNLQKKKQKQKNRNKSNIIPKETKLILFRNERNSTLRI